ncbi:hypothetical protein INR49_021380 [Caranx melampygus]|nr:hypothetical protein INR49_021380 [Caranx melampygus]
MASSRTRSLCLRSGLWSLLLYCVYSHVKVVLGEEAISCEHLGLGQSGYSYKVAVALSLFLGWLGADRFYLGYPALAPTTRYQQTESPSNETPAAPQRCRVCIVGPADGSNYIVDYYGARLTRLSITNQTYRKPHLSL